MSNKNTGVFLSPGYSKDTDSNIAMAVQYSVPVGLVKKIL